MEISIDHLNFNELRILNKKVVERLRYIDQMDTSSLMHNFEPDETVCFESNSGKIISGRISKFNKKTISILTSDNIQYGFGSRKVTHLNPK